MPSIQALLKNAAESLHSISDSATLDAEVLLCKVLGKDRVYLRTWPDNEMNVDQLNYYNILLHERQQGKPIAYITGHREFWSRDFHLSPDVLIPRPDTELLIEICLRLISRNQPCKVIDLGTGSGIIAVTLAAERPVIHITATDISPAALACAKANAAKHQVETIRFIQSNWFSHVPDEKYNLIVSNPPYLAEDDVHLKQGDLRYEPTTALVSAEHGLYDIDQITKTARDHLVRGGFLLIEHGYNQENSVRGLFRSYGYCNIQTYLDLSGQPRVTSAQYSSLE